MADSTIQEWLRRNAHRRFPLADDCSLECVDGVLPNDLVLDARACLFGPAIDESEQISIKGASIGPDGAISLRMSLPGAEDVRLEAGADGVASLKNRDASIRIVTGKALAGWSPRVGDYELLRPAPLLRSRVVSIPGGIGVDTLSAGDVTAWGDIRVAPGINTTLDIEGNALVLRVGRGRGLGPECIDTPALSTCEGRILYYLCGQKPDSTGDIRLAGGPGITVSNGTYRGIPAVIVCVSPDAANFLYRRM